MIRQLVWWPVCRRRGHLPGWIKGRDYGAVELWDKPRLAWGCRRCHRELIP